MKEKNIKELGDALELLSQANNAMIDAIVNAVAESDEKELRYEVILDIPKGIKETHVIKSDEDGNLCIFFNNKEADYLFIEDLSADDLYNICVELTQMK